ncbi:MAG: nucleotide exchange factor GrpE [Nitrososphaerales archaeon]|nr:nucleotide exchange factor GrpE [Nitrososphaerales archaeon]
MSEEGEKPPRAKQKGESEQEMEERLEQERQRGEELVTKMRYLQADFENYRKRMDKEMRDIQDLSVRSLVLRLLSVLDELELAVENAEKVKQKGEVLEGIKMVYRNLTSTLGAEGLERIEAVGRPFDPRLHEAVEKVKSSAKEDIVVEEVRSGYTFRGSVLRPSMVKVELASKKAGGQEARANE